MPTLILPRQLARLAGGQPKHDIPAETLSALIAEVCALFPSLAPALLDGRGRLSPFVGVFVDGEQRDADDEALGPLSQVQLVAAVAGG